MSTLENIRYRECLHSLRARVDPPLIFWLYVSIAFADRFGATKRQHNILNVVNTFVVIKDFNRNRHLWHYIVEPPLHNNLIWRYLLFLFCTYVMNTYNIIIIIIMSTAFGLLRALYHYHYYYYIALFLPSKVKPVFRANDSGQMRTIRINGTIGFRGRAVNVGKRGGKPKFMHPFVTVVATERCSSG